MPSFDSDYLLTAGFEEVLTSDERVVSDAVLRLERELPDEAKRTVGWPVLEKAIARSRPGGTASASSRNVKLVSDAEEG